MKIMINATILDDRPTGLGIYTLNIIKALSMVLDDDDKLVVYTSYPEPLKGLNVTIRKVCKILQHKFGIMAGIFRFLWVQFVFPLRLLNEEYDVIYHTTHHGIFFRDKTKSQIITLQNDIGVTFSFPKQIRRQYYYFKYLFPHLLRASSAVITTSAYARDVFLKYYGHCIDRIYYAHNSYNRDIFTSVRDQRDKDVLEKYGLKNRSYILNVSASFPHKNLENLLHAFRRLKNYHQNLYLCIAGYRKAYLDSLSDHKLNNDVILVQYVPQEEIGPLYRSASCLVLPSFHESFGIPCIEAMACGCPVVASDIPSLREVCGDAASYVDPYGVESIEREMHRVLTDDISKQNMIHRGLERAKLFSWNNSAENIYRIIKESCHTGKGP